MSVFLGQLPPAEVARLKAELAETLIANFCYPRFFDYRTGSLRTRPVDRTKRQEVWLYLNAVDFATWSRIDLMSSGFHRQIERVIIQFVQRNRSFFGEQGRKRMFDVRMLISSCSSQVVEGLRAYLLGHQPKNLSFGSPRPAPSWATTNVSGHHEPDWDQIAATTMLLQQQLQELRGEVQVPLGSEVGAVSTTPATWRTTQGRKADNGVSAGKQEVVAPQQASNGKHPPQGDGHVAAPLAAPKSIAPLPSPSTPVYGPTVAVVAPSKLHADSVGPLVESPTVPTPVVVPVETAAPQPLAHEQVRLASSPAGAQARGFSQPPQTPQPIQPMQTAVAGVSPGQAGVAANSTRTVAPGVNEDIAIFEQMRHQLIVWLRVEAVRLGMDISGQGPLQLLELLRQQNGSDGTRLQIVSTLLNLSNQVVKNGQATLLDYKQGLIFYLIHTQR